MAPRQPLRLIQCTAFLLAFLSHPVSTLGEDIEQILAKMREANSSVQYRGVLTTVFFNSPFTKVCQYQVAKYANGHRREELLTAGLNKEINFDDGAYLWRFFPNKHLVIREKSRLTSPLNPPAQNNLDLLKRNYAITVTNEKIDDRDGHKVLFAPKLPNRPLQIYWIDAHTGLPLKIERYGPKKTLLSISSFSAIDFRPGAQEGDTPLMVPPKTAIAQIEERGNLTAQDAEQLLDTHLPTPTYLPEGFTLRNIAVRTQGTRKTIQFFYTDGLSALSVFHRPHDPRQLSTPFDKQGAKTTEPLLTTTGTLNTIHLRSEHLAITLMGDVFRDELVKVAKSMPQISTSTPFDIPTKPSSSFPPSTLNAP